MLNIGFSELLLLGILGLVFIGPKDMPVLARQFMRFLRQAQSLRDEVKAEFRDVVKESGIDELKTTTIIDMEGRKQVAYDIADLETLKKKDE